jgi:hypothetical protein
MGVGGIVHIKLTNLVNHQGDLRWKHIKPTKNYKHKYNIYAINFGGNIWTSHLGLFLFILNILD